MKTNAPLLSERRALVNRARSTYHSHLTVRAWQGAERVVLP